MDACILYGYHTTGNARPEIVIPHYEALVRDNPGCAVVPVVCGYESWIHGTIDVEPYNTTCLKYTPATKDRVLWAHNDQLLWRYLNSPYALDAARYIYFDWDVLSRGMHVRNFYGNRWDADCVAIEVVHRYMYPDWAWFRNWVHVKSLLGFLPFCGTLFSKHAADLLRAFDWETVAPDFTTAQNEVRVATAAMRLGLRIRSVSKRSNMLHTYGGPMKLKDTPGIYHPVTSVPQ